MTNDGEKFPNWWMLTVPEDEDSTRVDRFLRRQVPGLTQGPVEKMLRAGLIRLDGKKARPADRLEAGQILRLPPHLRDGVDAPPGGGAKTAVKAPNPVADARLRLSLIHI